MEDRKRLRHQKRIRETYMARLAAAFMLAVIILTIEVSYILSGASEKSAFAEETGDEGVIVIPDTGSGALSGDGVSGNGKTEDKTEAGADNPKEKEEEQPVPAVKINITEPSGWHRKSAEVRFSAEDIADSGDFIIAGVRAKIGNGGSWTDVTDSMSVELSEDCVVYVEVTDTKGRTYSKNKKISCFDSTKPTLNAAVNNGNLTVETNDNDSGVKAVYVNGFEFTSLNEGTLNIRMQQFDTGYEYFAVQAMDYAGNMSDTYRVNNPYYKRKDASGKEAKILPDSAEATKPASSTATVTDHMKTDDAGNALVNVFGNLLSANSADPKSEEKKKSLAEADKEEDQKEETVPGKGREFYTIEAKTGKVFYLIIDRNGEDEEVRFVTDITENDLLNVTEDTSSTLPQNAAVSDTDAPVMESALPNNNRQIDDVPEEEKPDIFDEQAVKDILSGDGVSGDEPVTDAGEESRDNSMIWKVILILAVVLAVLGIRALNRKVKNRDGDFAEEEDPEGGDDSPDDDVYDDDGDVVGGFNTETETQSHIKTGAGNPDSDTEPESEMETLPEAGTNTGTEVIPEPEPDKGREPEFYDTDDSY